MNQTSSSNTTAIINNTSENRHPRTTLMDNTMENVPRITSGAILFMFVSLITLLASWIYVMVNNKQQTYIHLHYNIIFIYTSFLFYDYLE